MSTEGTEGTASPESTSGQTQVGGEQLAGIGAALILGDWLIFELLLDDYFFYWGSLVIAAFGLTVVWTRRNHPSTQWPVPAGWLLMVLGIGAGVAGLVALLSDLRNGVLDDVIDILGGLILYAGSFLMFWGGRQAHSDQTA